jgi:hypothetical protein
LIQAAKSFRNEVVALLVSRVMPTMSRDLRNPRNGAIRNLHSECAG